MFAPMRSPRGQVVDPWRLVRVAADADPSAGEYGLLDPRLADDPEMPREGLLSQIGAPSPAPDDGEALPIPARKPPPPPPPRATVPFALRDRTLEKPPFLSAAHEGEWGPFHDALRKAGMETEAQIDAARTIFGLEGGMAYDSSGPSVAGLKGSTLAGLNTRIKNGQFAPMPLLETDLGKLSLEEAARGYKAVFDDVLNSVHGSRALGRVRDQMAAWQMADILFHLNHNGAEAIQVGINRVIDGLPDSVQHAIGVERVTIDNIPDVGPQTFGAFNGLIDAGLAAPLRNAIADAQLDVLRRLWRRDRKAQAAGVSFEDWAGGQIRRVDYFR